MQVKPTLEIKKHMISNTNIHPKGYKTGSTKKRGRRRLERYSKTGHCGCFVELYYGAAFGQQSKDFGVEKTI